MTMRTTLQVCLTTLGLLFSTSSGRADVVFTATINTTPLVGHPAAPFSLDFQFNDGTTPGNNTATITVLSGGAPFGASGSTGPVVGTLPGPVTLTDSVLTDFFQEFTPGGSITFQVQLTTNVEAVPDQFSVAILDNTLTEIPTLEPNNKIVVLLVDINSANPAILTFPTDPNTPPPGGGPAIDLGAPAVVVQLPDVPEPGAVLLLVVGLGGLGVRRALRLRSVSPSTSH